MLWLPLIKQIIARQISKDKQLIIALDRTQWKENNILMVSAIYWQRKYQGKQEQSPWDLLTNLPDCETAVKIYEQRFGIEAMFKDCKAET